MTIDTNELRRLAQAATPGPWKMFPVGDGRQKFAVADSEFLSILTVADEGGATFGTVYDDADAKFIAAANPATINDLLDRLEAAESNAAHQKALAESALRVAEGWEERCNALRADKATLQQMTYSLKDHLEAAEKERDEFKRTCFGHISDNSMLRAKIERMEKQEPYSYIYEYTNPIDGGPVWRNAPGYWNNQIPKSSKALYALPGAKGEEK